ncbi:hypothetical protein NPIL_220431 [Nephila pilipes]|uniref:C2H2-type domain-containing protein n=1 Tax=Nephila pilipes TaxID=299642 RepID=A0A8X6U4T8_NEPPI|nr:hypothetical protein NPIL_220431 [Nephila pilipes]
MSDSSSNDSPPIKGNDSKNNLDKSTTPVALRTRQFSSQVSFRRAAELGQCKICPARFDSPVRLRKHVINHKSNAKRRKALEAMDSIYQSTPKTTVSPTPPPRSLFDKFKSTFPELFTQEMLKNPDPYTIFDPDASSSRLEIPSAPIVSPPLQFDSHSSSSPLQDDIISTLNKLITSVTEILDRPSFTDKDCSSRSLHQSICNSPNSASTPQNPVLQSTAITHSPPCSSSPVLPSDASSFHPVTSSLHSTGFASPAVVSPCALLPSPIVCAPVVPVMSPPAPSVASSCFPVYPVASSSQVPVSSSVPLAENSGLLFFDPKPQRGTHDDSLNSSSCIELENILNSTLPESALSSEVASLRQCVSAFPSARVSPDILDLLLPSTQDSDVLLSPVSTASPQPKLIKSPPSVPAPFEVATTPAFPKKSYAQALKKILAKCPFCEQKFYSQRTCDSHILEIHNPAAIKVNKPHDLELPSISEKRPPASSKTPKKTILAPKTDKPNSKSVKKVPPKSKVPDPPKNSANSYNRKSIIPPSTAYQRKILSLGELEKNPPTCSFLPKYPPYQFFCRHCQEYFPSDQSLTDHIKTNHNLLLNISCQKFHSQIVPALDPFSATNSNTLTKSTIVNKTQNIVVPQVEDHTDLVSPVKAFLENLYIPDPENLQNNPIKKGCLLPNITKTISNNSSSDSSPSADDSSPSAEVHNKPSSQPSPPRQCNLCDFVAKKKAGLRLHFYKEHRFQIIPPPAHLVDDSDKIDVLPSQEDPPPVIGILNKSKKVSFNIPADTPTFTTTPCDSPLPPDVLPPAHGFSDVDIDFQTPPPRRQTRIDPKTPVLPAKFVSFENSVLKFSFPLQKKLSCPVPNCSASFGTKLWYLTNSSIKKHLNVFHKSKRTKVEYFCTICNSLIKKLPSKHHCLINNLILPFDPVDDEVWVCDLCPDFSATTAIVKRNHLAYHNRLKILEDKTPLIVPPSASKLKKNRKKRIQVLSEGLPGDTPLARPQRNSNDPPPAVEEDLPLQEKLDLEHPSLLVSFVEPLDALLDVDEIDNILPTFENIVSDIVSVIQEHSSFSTFCLQST